MKKYIVLLKQNIVRNLEHRANNILYFFTGLVPAVVSYYSWLAIYGERGSLNGFDKEDILPYFLTITVLWYLIGGTIKSQLARDIKNGNLNTFLVKPIHPIVRYIVYEQGWKFGSLILILPIYVVALIILDLKLPIHSVSQFCVFILSIFQGGMIFALWDMILGMTSFFIDESSPLFRLSRIINSVLGGVLIPVAFFPLWVQQINNWLFWRYIFAFSNETIFMFEEINWPILLVRQFMWLILMLLIFNLVFKIGIKKYEAYGS